MDAHQQKNSRHYYKLNYLEAFFTSLVVGLAETYFIAFALNLGVSVIESGLLASIPLLFAGLSPFLFRRLFHRFLNSTWVLIGCAIQCVALASLALLGTFLKSGSSADFTFYSLLITFSVYWFGYYSAQPSWNRWIFEVAEPEQISKYFAKRTRFVQVGTILGLVLGGSALNLQILKWPTSVLFVGLFLVSYHFKFISYYLFYKQPRSQTYYELSWSRAIHFFKRHQSFFTSYSLFNMSLYFSSPFVSGYLLNIRHVSYQWYMAIFGAFFLGKIFTTIFLEKCSFEFFRRADPHQLYFWGGLIAAPLPMLWPFCEGLWAMSLLHFVSGFGWAFWEVGLSLAVFKKVNPHEKIEAVTVYQMIGLPTQVLGGVLGALLLRWFFHHDYSMMFIVSGVIRFILILPMKSKEFGAVSGS